MSLHTHRVTDRIAASGRIRSDFIAVPEERIRSLEAALKNALEGEVRFSAADRALYATDSSNYRQVPYGVVVPKSADDVVLAVRFCREHDVPVTPRGGGTSLAGQTCNSAVVIDFSKYLNRIVSLDPQRRLAVVEPGCVLDTLRDEAKKHGLTFGPDPSTHDRNTLGGMIGNDSCGTHSVMAGRTADNVRELDILTYDGCRMRVGATARSAFDAIVKQGGRPGEIYAALAQFWDRYGRRFEQVYPQIPRRISGYENLDQLSWSKGFNVARALVGTEATCVIVLQATLELVPNPPVRALAIVGFADVFQAADAVPKALESGPIALEGMDDLMTDYMRREHFRVGYLDVLPEGNGWLIAEFGGETTQDAQRKAEALAARMQPHPTHVVVDPAKQEHVWGVREAGLAVTADAPGVGRTWEGWEDSAVRPADLGKYLRELKALFHAHGYQSSVYGHFGDGLIHCRINFDLHSESGIDNWQRFMNEAADLVIKYGGSLSGEHGDGQARASLLEKMYGPELMQAQQLFRELWDPRQRMNPGKVLDPYPISSNLRLGPTYQPANVHGEFAYPKDGNFTGAMLRCVGVGKCRRRHAEGGVMCPSYLGTGEEKHSTRGRARLLFEMLRGEMLPDGFDSADVEEALDLCLACKGCKHDCPVQVDMATYKAEFRARHYAHRRRPRSAYSMGQIQTWARIGSRMPTLVNFATRTPGLDRLAKWAGGIAQARTIPRFAPRTFRDWYAKHGQKRGRKRLILWPDTFNNFFRPETAIAATHVLEACGYSVALPRNVLCCGRPLYDWGWIEQARRLWRQTMHCLRADIEAGTPIVGLEPACVSAFRDELPALFPNDPLAVALSKQTLFLSEFLKQNEVRLPHSDSARRKALVQFHCHQHSVLDTGAERALLAALPVDAEVLNGGCCGMAGSFGFEASKYALSMRIGEMAIFPKVRQAAPDTVILANGFSCREQIEQATGRRTMHIAQLLSGG